ncbi:MAG: helix-turn-helix transcriptional regulator, partial [Deltaproteobacteria bacterium]
MNRIQLGKKLKSYREETHLTQEQLADILSMDPKKISRIERGVQYPEEFYLRTLGQFSSLDIDEIEKDMLEATHSD